MSLTLGIVPARSGSKGVPGKNVRVLSGRPLIDYTACAARESGVLDRVILSTDSEEIADVGRRCGLEVPFIRPVHLAADQTPMLPVVRHAVDALAASGWLADLIVLLQPTSPLRRAAHIRDAVDRLRSSQADSVVTVVELPRHFSPDYVMRIENGMLKPFLPEGDRVARRQDARPAYSRDGTAYAFWRVTLERFGNIYGERCEPLVIDAADSLSIDSQDDWAAAERRLAGR
ncbi:MAG TPA: acylneuraminate cytidylyltransferase family protein [Vicinamibacterales bacterium]|jgi:CMP-N-acetylneuraminic acid synthetase